MALIDKFHIIRKAIALVQLFFCVVVFTFSLILLIVGGVAHASASSTSSDFYQTTDYLSGASLLVIGGLFGIIIAIIGALGAVPCLFDRQDNWNLWIGLIVLVIYILILLGIFIFEIAAGGWAYSQWDFVSGILEAELRDEVQRNYRKDGFEPFTQSVDSVQSGLGCCGIDNRTEWEGSEWSIGIFGPNNDRYSPHSCCVNGTTSNISVPDRMNSSMNITEEVCPLVSAHKVGCWDQIENRLRLYTIAIAGVAVALAILQLLITLVPIALLVIVIVELRRSRSLELK